MQNGLGHIILTLKEREGLEKTNISSGKPFLILNFALFNNKTLEITFKTCFLLNFHTKHHQIDVTPQNLFLDIQNFPPENYSTHFNQFKTHTNQISK